MKASRERIIEKAAVRAFERAKRLRPISVREFAAVWRREFSEWVAATCKCPYRATNLLGESNACVIAALDDFTMDLMLPSFRLPGMTETLRQAIDEEWPLSRIRAEAQSAVEEVLDEAIPPKEQLRRQAQMKSCLERVGVL